MQIRKKVTDIVNKTPNRRKIIKNVSWAVIGKVVNILYGLFIGVLVARYLGPEQFGLMNYVISYVTLFSILATFGLDNIEVRELSKHPEKRNEILGSAFSIRLVLSIITIVLIFITLVLFEPDRFTFIMVMVYSLFLVASTLNVIRNYFTSIVLNEYVVKSEIVRTFIGAGIKIYLLVYNYSLAWFIIANTFDFFLIAGGYLYSYRKKIGQVLQWSYSKTTSILLLKEAFPLLLSGTAIIIYQRIDQIIIRNLLDNAALGQFSVAVRITNLVVFVPMVIATTVTPILVQSRKENIKQYVAKRRQFFDVVIWASFGMALLVSLTAGFAISFLFGEKYNDAIPVLQIMAWKAVFVGLFASSGQIIIIEGVHKWAVIRNLIGMAVSIGLNFLLIPYFGIIGSAIASVVTMFFTGFMAHLFIKPYQFIFKLQINSLGMGFGRTMKFIRG